MHEISLVSALVEQIEEIARTEGFLRVLEIRLGVGALSGVEPACLEFCFPEVTRESVLEGAKLVMESIAVELFCTRCEEVSHPEDAAALFCARCQSGNVVIRKGREFRVVDLEVEDVS